MFSEETSVFSVECYFAMFSDIAKTGSGSSRALSELVEFTFPLPYWVRAYNHQMSLGLSIEYGLHMGLCPKGYIVLFST